MELKVVCDLSLVVCVWVQLFCSPCNPLTPRHGSLLPLICPFSWIKVASSTRAQSRAQSRGTRTLVRRDTSDTRPLALGHSRRPLALWHPRPLLPFGPWSLFPRGQHLLSTVADGGLYLSAALGARGALGPWWPPTYGGLWPMGHPWPR